MFTIRTQCFLLVCLLLSACTSASRPGQYTQGEDLICPSEFCTRPVDFSERFPSCAAQTLRAADEFAGFVSSDLSLEDLCGAAGQPDWVTGSGLSIYIYQLNDDGALWFGFAGDDELMVVRQVSSEGSVTDWLPASTLTSFPERQSNGQ